MAIQNNVKATFYGKVGQMVGMRWKDKTSVRMYVVPANPRTPLQQDNRARFKLATELSQEALSINKGAPCWDNASLTEFQMRVSTSKRRIDEGVVGFPALPLFPNGYTPSTIISDLTLQKGATPQASAITSEQLRNIAVSREIFVVLQYMTANSTEPQEMRSIVTTTVGSNILVQQLPADVDLSKTMMCFAISTEDRQHNNEMIYAAIKQLQ